MTFFNPFWNAKDHKSNRTYEKYAQKTMKSSRELLKEIKTKNLKQKLNEKQTKNLRSQAKIGQKNYWLNNHYLVAIFIG